MDSSCSMRTWIWQLLVYMSQHSLLQHLSLCAQHTPLTHVYYVVTWNVKTYITHSLECKMSQEWLKWCSDTTTTTNPATPKLKFLDLEIFLSNFRVVGVVVVSASDHPTTLNSTWLFGHRNFSCETLGWWGGSGICIRLPPPPPLNSTWFLDLENCLVKLWGGVVVIYASDYHHHPPPPIGPTVGENNFSGFGHFIKFPATLVRWTFWTPHPHPHPISQTVKKNFFSDLGISSNFLQLWFRCKFWPPPPIAQTVKIVFSGFRHFIKFPATLVQVNILSPHPPSAKQWKKTFLVDLGISSNFLQLWFRCTFDPPPSNCPNSEK